MKKFLRTFILMLLMAVLSGVVFAFTFDFLQGRKPVEEKIIVQTIEPHLSAEPMKPAPITTDKDVIQVIEGLKNTIVGVYTEASIGNSEPQLMGAGSGVCFKEDDTYYYIITNNHVIEGGNRYSIHLLDGERIEAESMGSDRDTDLAVLRVAKKDIRTKAQLQVAPLGKSRDLVVGENVLAIGNALGYGQSVTKGIVSAINRDLEGYSGNFAYKLIQTDAPINPGNSGGALVNAKGEVVGINTLKISDQTIEGIGFAIPIEPANEIVATIMEIGYLPKTFLGVSTQEIDPAILAENNLPKGIVVFAVTPGSPADLSGIEREDIILKVAGQETLDTESLSYAIRSHKPGDEVIVSLYRNGSIMEIKVVLGETKR